jgi:hypothetical protein
MAAVMSPDESTTAHSDSASRVSDVEVCSRATPLCNLLRLSQASIRYFLINIQPQQRLNNEINQLVKDIWRVGDPEKPSVPFGELFDDEDVQQHYEGLAATLKAAKKSECIVCKNL